MSAPRFPDWRVRLLAYLAEVSRRQFGYGSHDCGLFVAGAIAAMTGTDPAQPWRGQYSSLKSGLKRLRRAGFADHVAVAAAIYPEIHPSRAGVGDIAAVDGDDGLAALGLVQGELIYVLRPDGLATLPLISARRAFRI